MSETDSFIEEVSEEVRRDKLFGFFRKYAWAFALVVVGIVGAATYYEYSKAQRAAAFQARGDALRSALQEQDPQSRLGLLSALDQTGPDKHLNRLFRAQAALEAGNREEAVAAYDTLSEDASAAELYRDLAVLKSVYLTRDEAGLDAQRTRLDPLTVPGRPFRLLALEARAVAFMQANQTDAALEDLTSILLDPEIQRSLAERAQQLVVILGGELPDRPGLLAETGENAGETQ